MNVENVNIYSNTPFNLAHNGKRARSKSVLITPAILAKQAANDEKNIPLFKPCVKRQNANGILKDQAVTNETVKNSPKKQVSFKLA